MTYHCAQGPPINVPRYTSKDLPHPPCKDLQRNTQMPLLGTQTFVYTSMYHYTNFSLLQHTWCIFNTKRNTNRNNNHTTHMWHIGQVGNAQQAHQLWHKRFSPYKHVTQRTRWVGGAPLANLSTKWWPSNASPNPVEEGALEAPSRANVRGYMHLCNIIAALNSVGDCHCLCTGLRCTGLQCADKS